MDIVVAVKQVAHPDEDFALLADPPRIDPDDLDRSLNEWDRFAIEAALQLREASGEGRVVVVTVGGEEAEEALRTALAQGADAALRIAAEDDLVRDPFTVARLLARAVAGEPPDLVLCGAQSSDGAHAATGVALAALLELPRVAVARRLALAPDGGLELDRELEGGLLETLAVALPALVTVQTGANEPRYVNLRAIKLAREKPLEVRELADLGLDAQELRAGAAAQVRALAHPAGGEAERLEGDAAQVAARILAIVKERTAA